MPGPHFESFDNANKTLQKFYLFMVEPFLCESQDPWTYLVKCPRVMRRQPLEIISDHESSALVSRTQELSAKTDVLNATRSVRVGSYLIGSGGFAVIAGPCSIESFEQTQTVAETVQSSGAQFLRGGLFKLRTRPDSFQGLGPEAFQWVREIKGKLNLPFVSEIVDPRQIDDLHEVVDVFQVGSRNMHNYALLKELGHLHKPVLLKRGFAGLISEWLHSAEYILQGGNENIILCERGIRTFETATRNTLDLNAVAYLKRNTDFPVIVDPSHGTGRTDLVEPLCLAAAAVGADGIMVEVHPQPTQALSDGFQALMPKQFEQMMKKLGKVLGALDRELLKSETPLQKDWPSHPTLNL